MQTFVRVCNTGKIFCRVNFCGLRHICENWEYFAPQNLVLYGMYILLVQAVSHAFVSVCGKIVSKYIPTFMGP